MFGFTCCEDVTQKMEAFEIHLRQRLSTMPLPSNTTEDCSKIFRRTDATIVLFYDHLTHATPDEHVESIERVQTCMRKLAEQLHGQTTVLPQSAHTDSMDDADGEATKRLTQRARRLHLVCCNDVAGPPAWCLPLVHSPQYLAHLQSLSLEAREGDLYVPLEFDTEWVRHFHSWCHLITLSFWFPFPVIHVVVLIINIGIVFQYSFYLSTMTNICPMLARNISSPVGASGRFGWVF